MKKRLVIEIVEFTLMVILSLLLSFYPTLVTLEVILFVLLFAIAYFKQDIIFALNQNV